MAGCVAAHEDAHFDGRTGLRFRAGRHDLPDDRGAGTSVMGKAANHYLVFETAGGFCGIAWNDVGITRFQLPTHSAAATERNLLRRLPGANPAWPPPLWREAVGRGDALFRGETWIWRA